MLRLCGLLKTKTVERAINIIYRGTAVGGPARRMTVDLYVHFARFSALTHEANPTFLLDLAEDLPLKAETIVAPAHYRGRRLEAPGYLF